MDPQTDLPDLIEDLEVNIDELTTTLRPLLPPSTLSKTAAPLPLLEKAKLHVLAAYAIESTLFSTLQASGTDAKAHPIFAELARLKGYFAKIKDAEDHIANLAAKENRARIDVGAAQRFIKHGLAGNEKYDELRKERVKREKERALDKARALTNKKFDDETPQKRTAEEDNTPNKRAKLDESTDEDDAEEEEQHDQHNNDTPATTRSRKTNPTNTTVPDDDDTLAPAKKKRGRPSKKDKSEHATTTSTSQDASTSTPTRATRSTAPKTRSEAFQALASASPASASASTGKKSKGKRRGKK